MGRRAGSGLAGVWIGQARALACPAEIPSPSLILPFRPFPRAAFYDDLPTLRELLRMLSTEEKLALDPQGNTVRSVIRVGGV